MSLLIFIRLDRYSKIYICYVPTNNLGWNEEVLQPDYILFHVPVVTFSQQAVVSPAVRLQDHLVARGNGASQRAPRWKILTLLRDVDIQDDDVEDVSAARQLDQFRVLPHSHTLLFRQHAIDRHGDKVLPVAREAKTLLAAQAGAGVTLTFRWVLGAALEFLAAGLGAGRAGLVAEGVALPVPAALPGTRLLARRAGRSARLLAVAMATGRAARLLLARQTVRSAGQGTLVTAAWQRATATLLACDVHASRPARAARAFAHVTAVESDAAWTITRPLP